MGSGATTSSGCGFLKAFKLTIDLGSGPFTIN
jgi:hypothetical protein